MEGIYKRKAHYHETDQMGVVHHSNYIKWFEEARIHLMDSRGISYKMMEAAGIMSPVIGVDVEYKAMVLFDEAVHVHVTLEEYNGIRYKVTYKVTNEDNTVLHAIGHTKHCFVSRDKRVVSLKKKNLQMHNMFEESMVNEK